MGFHGIALISQPVSQRFILRMCNDTIPAHGAKIQARDSLVVPRHALFGKHVRVLDWYPFPQEALHGPNADHWLNPSGELAVRDFLVPSCAIVFCSSSLRSFSISESSNDQTLSKMI